MAWIRHRRHHEWWPAQAGGDREKDDQGKPDVGKAALAAAYADDKVDIAVGPTASPVGLAMLPVAEEYKKILLVEPAVADSITGDKVEPHIFRTGPQQQPGDAIANAAALDQRATIATLANDNAFGRDGVKAGQGVHQEGQDRPRGVPARGTTDFTAGLQRIIDKLKDQPGGKYHVGGLGGRPDAVPGRSPTWTWKSATASSWPPAATSCRRWWPTRQFPGMEGALYYYFGIPKNPVNEWLVANHYSKFKAPPDFFTAGGMSAASPWSRR